MSFSISAQGTKEQVMHSLQYQNVAGTLGAGTLRLLAETMADAPAEVDGRPLRYSISASGHADRAGYSSPYLSIAFGSIAEPDPAAQAPAADAEPAAG